MKYLIPALSLAVVAFCLQQFMPWWTPALAALGFGATYHKLSAFKGFAIGFLSIFLMWAIWSFYSNSMNDGILSARIGELFGGLNELSVIVATALIGGVLGGLGFLTGKLTRDALS